MDTIRLKPEAQKIVDKLKQLQSLGYTREQTFKVFQDLDLPLGLHLYISGNWSALGLK